MKLPNSNYRSRLRLMRTAFALAPLCAFAAEPVADLTELSLDDLSQVTVQTVSRREENLDQAPNTIYVLTKDQMRERGYQRIQDVLQVIPGFGVAHRDLGWVNQIRGIAPNDNEKLTVMINGVPVNALTEPQYMNGAISLDALERVEVVVGPGSVMYGSETLLATINLITRKVGANEAAVTLGSNGIYTGTGVFSKKWTDTRWLSGTVTVSKRDGFNAFKDTSRNGLSDSTFVDQLDKGLVLTAQAQYDAWQFNSSFQYSQFPELGLRSSASTNHTGDYKETVGNLTARRNFEISPDLTWFTQFGYDYKSTERVADTFGNYDYSYFLHQHVFSGEAGLEWNPTERTVVQAGVQTKYKYNALGEYRSGFGRYTIYDQDTQSGGVYLSGQHRLNKLVQLVAAGRVDRDTVIRDTAAEYGARLGLIVTPTKTWTSKLTYNRATRVPTPWMSPINTAWGSGGTLASYYNSSGQGFFAANPMAKDPEILTTYEWDNIVYLGKARWSVGVYYQELKNFMSWNNPFTNVGDFSGPGIETSFNTPLGKDVDFWVGASAQDTTAVPLNNASASGGTTGLQLVAGTDRQLGVPRYLANTGLTWKITPSVSWTVQGRYVGQEPLSDGVPSVSYVNRYYLDSSILWRDVIKKGLDVSLALKNVLNNRDPIQAQFQPYTYHPEGITASVTAYYRF